MFSGVKFGWLGSVAGVGLLAMAWTAAAGNFYWSNTGGGDYAVGSNWSSNAVPGSGDAAYFNLSADYAVNWSADATAAGATFNAASGKVTLNLGSSTWTTPVGVGNAAGYSTVVQNGGTLQATNGLGVGSGGGNRGSMTVTNGGRLYTRGQNVGAWGGGSGSALVVSGTGTVMTVQRASSGYSHQWYENASKVVVTNGGVLNDAGNGHVYIGNSATSNNNTWLVTGAGSVYSNTAGMFFYLGNSGSDNRLTISDGGSFYDSAYFMTSTSNNQVLVTGSNSTLSLGYSTALGTGPGGYNTLTVTNRGQVNLGLYNGIGSATSAPGNAIIVTGPGSLLSAASLTIGDYSEGNRLVITNGGRVNMNGNMTVSSRGTSSASNNTVVVTGTNSMLWLTRTGGSMTLTVGSTGSGSLLVTDQGIVELSGNGVNGSRLATGAYGVITNWGGVYQFAGGIDANQIVNGTPGSIVITNGTVSFRAFSTADVFCNQGGQPLDSTNKLVWLGDNTFRLNAATNVAGQNYTFQTGSPTNFAGLSLINGSRYQGNVTVGSGGTLSCSGGPETLAGTLAMQTDTTLALALASSNDTLTVTGAVNLAGAQLQVTLNADPTPYYPIRFLRTAGLGESKFSTRIIETQYQGTNFGMKVRYDANGKDVWLYDEGVKGTLLLLY